MLVVDYSSIGKTCKAYRQVHGIRQCDVALDTGFSIESISAFECGRNDSMKFLLWYINKGLTIDDIRKDGGIYER